MMYFTVEKKDCTGCSACEQICPIKCVSMVRDEEGFLYPVANDSCIHCGKCARVCPIQHDQASASVTARQAYAAKTKSREIWGRSASGGAFSEICLAWNQITDKCSFVGAAWNDLYVEHKVVASPDNLEMICKSKYVNSDIGRVFSDIESLLSNNQGVVFCGTPCQVAGLKAYLGEKQNNQNLLLIDFICHGVGSPIVFKEAMNIIGEQLGDKVVSYEFRSKRKIYETDYLTKVDLKRGKSVYMLKDQYMQLFLSQNILRPSCGKNCKFRNEQRQGDLTIADFKGLIKVFPQLKGYKQNYSTIVVNSEQGKKVIDHLRGHMTLLECDISDIKKYNPLFYRQTKFSETRDQFFNDFEKNPKCAIKKWTTNAQIARKNVVKVCYELMPVSVRKVIYNLREKKS